MRIAERDLHLVDDPGWRVEISKYPRLTEVGAFRGKGEKRYGGYYTKDDIREFVAYATKLHIDIVPEIELPAHIQSALVAYPWLGCTDKALEVPTTHVSAILRTEVARVDLDEALAALPSLDF